MARDPKKALARKRRWRAEQHKKKYGPDAGNMRGRHGHHARGARHPRWNEGRILTSHGYVAVRVAKDHPHVWGAGYAYEHIVLMETHLGRSLADDEMVHHKDGNRANNEIANLVVLTVTAHMREHADLRGRDALGRFPPTGEGVLFGAVPSATCRVCERTFQPQRRRAKGRQLCGRLECLKENGRLASKKRKKQPPGKKKTKGELNVSGA